jgi:predicted transcriptional regulator
MENLQLLTRKGASCSDLLICLYNLKQIDMDILFHVAQRKQATLDQLSSEVKRDRSTVHRSLAKLVSLDLVNKSVRAIKEGGYYHVYMLADETKIKERANLKVEEITQGLERLVDNLIPDLRRHLKTI